jgi:hypothetical protein
MNLEEFTISAYLWLEGKYIDMLDFYPNYRRQTGLQPSLTPVEVATLEILGESQGYKGTRAIWRYADAHWRHYFPRLPSYKTFARLWARHQ